MFLGEWIMLVNQKQMVKLKVFKWILPILVGEIEARNQLRKEVQNKLRKEVQNQFRQEVQNQLRIGKRSPEIIEKRSPKPF